MEFVPVLVLSAAVKKLVDFVRYARAGDANAVVTQLLAWLAGVLVMFAAAKSDYGDAIAVNGQTLGSLNPWSLIFVGFNVASAAGLFVDAVKALDNTDSAHIPTLLEPTNGGSA